MKLVIDEKLKHRLIGVAVIISLGAIFAPAMMKKSSQNTGNNYSVSVKLPPKPKEPNVAVADEKEVFKTIKIARVKMPEVTEESQLPKLAKAEILHDDVLASHETSSIDDPKNAEDLKSIQLALNNAAQHTVKTAAKTAAKKPIQESPVIASNKATKAVKKSPVVAVKKVKPAPLVRPVKVASRAVVRQPIIRGSLYAVQLASFSKLTNAQALVNRLHSKGYKATYARIATRNGVSYKVFAGHSPRRTDVVRVKSQLANAMQLNGFIVNTRVS